MAAAMAVSPAPALSSDGGVTGASASRARALISEDTS